MWGIFGAIGTMLIGMLAWGVKVLITAVFDNTVAIKVLNEKIGELVKYYSRTEKLENDVTEAHNRIRQLQQRSN